MRQSRWAWRVVQIAATMLLIAREAAAFQIYDDFPQVVHPDQSYVIYSHGLIVEGGDPKPVHPEHGVYDFPAIKSELFANGDFNLIAPHRPKSSDATVYVAKLEAGIRRLMASGVSAGRITLVGFSRGAQLTAVASSRLQQAGISTALLAVCINGDYAASPPVVLGGRLLSIFETSDEVGSCAGLARRSRLTSFEEIALSTGARHGAFYRPRREWVEPLKEWIARGQSAGAVSQAAAPSDRAVAITIDDLPRGLDGGPRDFSALRAMTVKLLQPFRERRIPVIGFVNAGRYSGDESGLRELLTLWIEAGAQLGNHSYSHPDINTVALDAYTADVLKGEQPLRDVLAAHGQTLKYFRHPYLHVGASSQAKKGLERFLTDHGYTAAPVTLDNSDYAFAAAYLKAETHSRARRAYVPYIESTLKFFESRAVEVVGREFPQILLIHANQLNADLIPELLAMFERRGYRFITLDEALRDPAYRQAESYIGKGGFSWIHRWSREKGLPDKGEPEAPAWVIKAFQERR